MNYTELEMNTYLAHRLEEGGKGEVRLSIYSVLRLILGEEEAKKITGAS